MPDEDTLREALAAAGIDPWRRGETLTPAEFGRLDAAILAVRRKKA
jgi:hypothetical protein